jgi:hypothetical protein
MRKEDRLWVLWRGIIASFALVSFSGCSLFAPSMQTIHITSSPEGAKVRAGDKRSANPQFNLRRIEAIIS